MVLPTFRTRRYRNRIVRLVSVCGVVRGLRQGRSEE